MAGRPRDDSLDAETRPLLEHACANLGQWVPLLALDDRGLRRSARWLAYSRYSPLGWCPDGVHAHARYSVDVMWRMPDGGWTRDINAPGAFQDGLRIGRLKLIEKRSDTA